jgi:3-dehydroquinate dehydratase
MKSLEKLKLKQKRRKIVKSYTLSPETIEKIEKLAEKNKVTYVDIIEFSIDFLCENIEKSETA